METCKKCGGQFDPQDSMMGDDTVCQDCWEHFCDVTWWQMVHREKLSNLDEWEKPDPDPASPSAPRIS